MIDPTSTDRLYVNVGNFCVYIGYILCRAGNLLPAGVCCFRGLPRLQQAGSFGVGGIELSASIQLLYHLLFLRLAWYAPMSARQNLVRWDWGHRIAQGRPV